MIDIIYWGTTGLLSMLYLASATMYLTKWKWTEEIILSMGYPAYLVPILIVAKVLAVMAIVSRLSVPLSDLAYAGVFYHLLFSAAAHIGVRKPAGAVPAFAGLLLLLGSFLTQNGVREALSPYAPTFGL